MTVAKKMMSVWVDTGLTIGLILALGGVYSVETRLPRPAVNAVEEGNAVNEVKKADEKEVAEVKTGYEKKIKVEKGLSGTTEIVTYVLRTKKDKAKWIGQFGGSPETEGCVQMGLDWLVRHQADDGFWSNACLGPKGRNPGSKCEEGGLCTVPGQDYVMSQTGLALLALQAAGNYESNQEKYSNDVRRGLDWLIEHQRPDGALVGPLSGQDGNYRQTHMYEHAMAAFALAEACAVRKAQGEADAPKLRNAAVRAIEFIERNQHNDGGWRYTTEKQERSDCSVSGWAMLALKSAKEAEIPISRDTLDQTRYFFKSCETSDGRTAYQSGEGAGSDAITAVGMLTHLLLLKDREAPVVKTSASHLADQAERYRAQVRGGIAEFYTLYNATLAMYQTGGDNWNRWNDAVRDAVVANQTKGSSCERGSWDPRGTFGGDRGGRIYSTALATLMLEVYYRFSREGDGKVSDAPH
jgi:prenyltransferase beta subunit